MSILTDQQLDDLEQWALFDVSQPCRLIDARGDEVAALITEVRELRKLRAAIETALAATRGEAS